VFLKRIKYKIKVNIGHQSEGLAVGVLPIHLSVKHLKKLGLDTLDADVPLL
jgi:hypothetical protein